MNADLMRQLDVLFSRVEALERENLSLRDGVKKALALHDDFPDDRRGGADEGDWTGRISVAKTRWVVADWTGITPTDWLRIYYDAATPPSYTTSADYLGDWGDEYEVVRVKDLYAHHGDYIVNRA